MSGEQNKNATLACSSYAALRHGGAPPSRARSQLGLPKRVAFELEQLFRKRCGAGPGGMRPKFARHEQHVRAVLKGGGFPVLPERRR
jgi:hypothetical protein